jgi:glucose-6-phosphate 1-dehydrogenase
MQPYERLLSDAMRGDQMLFARQDAVEASWRVVDPVIGPNSSRAPSAPYATGTWGPAEAEALIPDGWHNPA